MSRSEFQRNGTLEIRIGPAGRLPTEDRDLAPIAQPRVPDVGWVDISPDSPGHVNWPKPVQPFSWLCPPVPRDSLPRRFFLQLKAMLGDVSDQDFGVAAFEAENLAHQVADVFVAALEEDQDRGAGAA